MDIKDLTVTAKCELYSKSNQWRRMKLPELPGYVASFDADWFARGSQALYIGPVVEDSKGGKWVLPFLDVENPGDHGNLLANIEAGRDALSFFIEAGLSEDLEIFCSGSAFRFCLPMLVPPQMVDGLIQLTKSIEWIDHSAFVAKNQFLRMLGFRSPHQDRKKKCNHIHKLEKANDIFTLTPARYGEHVQGHANLEESLLWLDAILPTSTNSQPDALNNLLEPYQHRARLKYCLVDFIQTPTMSTLNQNALAAAKSYLDELGITYRKIERSTGTIHNLNKCPKCTKPSRAYVTMSGRLKCWSTNCEAGVRNENDIPVGLPPWKWISGFEEIFVATKTENDQNPEFALFHARQQLSADLDSPGNATICCSAGVGKTFGAINYGINNID